MEKEKINIVELLRDCPEGMELDCVLWDNVTFERVADGGIWVKHVDSESREHSSYLYNDGSFPLPNLGSLRTKCVIFPKGKTTWEGFIPPYKFNDGDVISAIVNKNLWYGIYQKVVNAVLYCYAEYSTATKSTYLSDKHGMCLIKDISEIRLATQDEKQKLFQAIKDNGCWWDEKTKTLKELVELRFKVGDRIQWYGTHINHPIRVVKSLECDRYRLDNGNYIKFGNEHAYKLLKFDITTLKPFDQVLVRTDDNKRWRIQFFERLNNVLKDTFVCMNGYRYQQCVPYKGNEHLLDTSNEPDVFYRTWEK